MSDNDLEQLREATETGSKLDETDAEKSFVDTLVDCLDTYGDDARGRTVTANDPRLWVMFKALDADDDRRKEFCDELGIEYDPSGLNRSHAVRELIRAGIKETDPDLDEEMRQAVKKNESDSW